MWSLLALAVPLSALDLTRSPKDNSLRSFICPLLSRHVEVWDELPDGRNFKARFGQKVRQELPPGCTTQEPAHRIEEPGSFLQVGVNLIGEATRQSRHRHGHSPQAHANTPTSTKEFRPALVPYPKSVSLLDKSSEAFVMCKDIDVILGPGISKDTPHVAAALASLQNRLANATAHLPAAKLSPCSVISVGMAAQKGADEDSYKLTVKKGHMQLEAHGAEGFSYGVTTLQQLIPLAPAGNGAANSATVPAMVIEDAPSFKWRGLHLDVSRHFFPPEDVKKLLRTMAAYKLNRFHWHLTDDQGWRFPVQGYPELTRKGAGPRFRDSQLMSSGTGIEGSYTEADIRDVLAFAKARHIQVIPEVDVPGHAAAAISAYPELGNKGFAPPAGPQHEFGVHQWTLAPTKASAKFLDAVFTEIARLFPDSEYIHFGGDEAPQDQWKHSSAEARKDWEAFEGSNAQSYFNQKVSDIIRSKGKKMAGWDEAQSMASLPKDAAIFAWRSEGELRKALQNGRPAVNAVSAKFYLDHYQGPEATEPKAIGGPVTTVKDVYEYDPMPAWVKADQRHLLLGAQAQLWSEYFPNWQQVEYMAWPRAIALAERLWTPKKEVSYPDFRQRLGQRVDDLTHWGVRFHPLPL